MLTRVPPDWDVSLDTLYRAVSDPNKRWQRGRLTLPEAVRELIEATKLHHGRRMGLARRDWHSLRQDALAAFDELEKINLGSPLSILTTIGGEYVALRNAIKKFPNDYERLHGSAEALLVRLDSDTTCASAWDDLIRTSERLRYDAFSYLRDTFISIAHLRGHGADGGSFRLVSGVLGDTAYQVVAAQGLVGASKDEIPPNSSDLAGRTKADRLELIRRVWAQPTRRADNVVWLSYKNNKLDDTRPTTVGQVTFYPRSWLKYTIETNPGDVRVPPEIRDVPAQAQRVLFPENDQSSVLARVELGNGPVATALHNGRDTVESILDLFGRRGLAWREAGLTVHYCDGQYSGYSRFLTNDELEEWTWSGTDPVSASLESQDGKIPSIPLDQATKDCVRVMRIVSEKSGSPDEVTINVVRGVEIVRKDTGLGANWTALLEEYVRDHWVASSALQEIVDALQMVSHMEEWKCWLRSSSDERDVSDLIYQLGRPAFNLGRTCKLAIPIYTSLDPNWLPARRLKQALRTISHTTTTHAPRTAVNQLGLEFARLVTRIRRRRNAAAHGSRVLSVDFADVVPFADRISSILLAPYVEAKALQECPSTELQGKQATAKARVEKLLAGNMQDVADSWQTR